MSNFSDDLRKSILERRLLISDRAYGTSDILNDSMDNILSKGKVLPIGTVRTWTDGKKYKKTHQGWREVAGHKAAKTKTETKTETKTKTGKSISSDLMSDIKSIVDDPEFQYDFNLDAETSLKTVLEDKKLFHKVLNQLKNDYERDIKSEEGYGEDTSDLKQTLNEINSLLSEKTKQKSGSAAYNKKIAEFSKFLSGYGEGGKKFTVKSYGVLKRKFGGILMNLRTSHFNDYKGMGEAPERDWGTGPAPTEGGRDYYFSINDKQDQAKSGSDLVVEVNESHIGSHLVRPMTPEEFEKYGSLEEEKIKKNDRSKNEHGVPKAVITAAETGKEFIDGLEKYIQTHGAYDISSFTDKYDDKHVLLDGFKDSKLYIPNYGDSATVTRNDKGGIIVNIGLGNPIEINPFVSPQSGHSSDVYKGTIKNGTVLFDDGKGNKIIARTSKSYHNSDLMQFIDYKMEVDGKTMMSTKRAAKYLTRERVEAYMTKKTGTPVKIDLGVNDIPLNQISGTPAEPRQSAPTPTSERPAQPEIVSAVKNMIGNTEGFKEIGNMNGNMKQVLAENVSKEIAQIDKVGVGAWKAANADYTHLPYAKIALELANSLGLKKGLTSTILRKNRVDELMKGKKANIGEIRTWSNG